MQKLRTGSINKVILLLNSLFILGCGSPGSFEKALTLEEQFEEITHINFPKDFKVVSDTSSNSNNLVKRTIIEMSKKNCQGFYKSYGFRPVVDSVSPILFDSKLMDSIYKLIPDKNKFLHLYGKKSASPKYFNYNTEKGANWVYLLDTTTCRLYCLISYEDLNGYAR